MNKEALSALAQRMVDATRDFVRKAEQAINARLEAIESRIDALPEPERGERGERGEQGEQGEAAEAGSAGAQGIQGEDGAAGKVGAQGIDGPRGEPGELGESGADGGEGLQGRDGERGEAGQNGADGAQGEQGTTTPEHVVESLVASHVQAEVGKLPIARDGEDGRDAADLIVLPSIDPKQSYRRGTYVSHDGGLLQSTRATDALALTDGDLNDLGWRVVVEGIAAIMVSHETGRMFQVACRLTSGITTISDFKLPVMIYQGIWKDGDDYEHGDVVTWSGSAWHCQEDTQDKPGTSDKWKLMVKRGNPGKDGDKPPAEKKVVRTK